LTPRQVPPASTVPTEAWPPSWTCHYDRAIADYDEAICLRPEYGFAFYNRGSAWEEKEDISRAIADYNEALRIDPGDIWAAEALKRLGSQAEPPTSVSP
jgi:tetratricopeptide (TPR) repeat protein